MLTFNAIDLLKANADFLEAYDAYIKYCYDTRKLPIRETEERRQRLYDIMFKKEKRMRDMTREAIKDKDQFIINTRFDCGWNPEIVKAVAQDASVVSNLKWGY